VARVYDEEQQDKKVDQKGADELRDITGIGVGEEDQIDSAAKEKFKRMAAREGTRAALKAAEAGAFGEKIKPLAKLGREEFDNLTPEQLANIESHIFGDPGRFKNPGWYKQQAKAGAARGSKSFLNHLVHKHKKILMATLAVNVVVALLLLALFVISPFKSIHFETIMRAANFARFQLLIRKQFSDVIFNAAVLTDDSVGNFKNSPLVRQIRLAVPDKQLEQLGRSGKIKWEFRDNRSFGDLFQPWKESLKAVTIDGERVDIDTISQEAFGKNYNELSQRQRWTIQSRFVRTVNAKLGDLMALMPRHVRWKPQFRVQQRSGMRLSKWLNAGRDYLGLSPDEADAKNAADTARQVWNPGSLPKSAIPDFNDAAVDRRGELVEAKKAGRPPGKLRSKIAAKAELARGASDVVFASTAYCVSREMIKIFTPEFQASREAQAIRMAGNDMTSADQIKSGDVTTPVVRVASEQWDAQGDIPDASSAVLYKQATGQPVPKTSTYQQQIPWLNPMQALGPSGFRAFQEYNNIAGPLIIDGPLGSILKKFGIDIGTKQLNDGVCNALLNEYVQYGIAGVETVVAIATLGAAKGFTAAIKGTVELVFHFAVGLGLDALLNILINWTINELAGAYFTGLEQGADRFNTGYVAQSSVAQVSNRSMTYGRPMTQEETNAAQTVAMDTLRAENRDKPFSERYFAIDNPYSLLGLTVARLPASTGGFAASLQNGLELIGSILSSPLKLLGSLNNIFTAFKPAYAAGANTLPTSYGVDQWGWTLQEQERIENDPTFSLFGENGGDPPLLARVEPRLTELNKRYGKCYDDTTFQLQADRPLDCTRELLSEEDALYWRYYNALMFNAVRASGSI
jgi:hypothetical protein